MPKKKSDPESFEFKAEASQLLRLMARALYSNKEIFLRELIANASDAIDKLRFRAISDPALLGDDPELAITVEYDVEKSTLTVSDNGIGMSREEIIDHLGTIAKSGTAKFLQSLTDEQKEDASLIGQFGVGFYSAFVVADRVEVRSRHCDAPASKAVRFISTGDSDYTVEPLKGASRGTSVCLFMKPEEASTFLNSFKIKEVIKKYADHLSVPVKMPKEAAFAEAEAEDDADTDDESAQPEEKAVVFETINQAKALWTRPRQEITEAEYEDFFMLLTRTNEPPLIYSHNKIEGKLEYTSLLYIPKTPPFDLYNRQSPKGLKLYVQRIFIMDDVEQFLPLYLRFVRGLVDTNDLPLNISRELVQEDSRIASMRSAFTKRILERLIKLAEEDAATYMNFWQSFGAVLKEGIIDDAVHLDQLKSLLRYPTALSAEDDASSSALADYVQSMQPEQEKIYYLICDSLEIARKHPHLEVFRNKGLDVLLCHHHIDTWVMPQINEYEGKPLQDITRGELNLDDEDQKSESKTEDDQTDTKSHDEDSDYPEIAAILKDRVRAVKTSKRLVDSSACLVLAEYDLSENMRKLMEATTGELPPAPQPLLELNPEHPMVQLTATLDGEELEDMAMILFEQAALAEGQALPDPSAFVQRLNRVLVKLAGTPNA